MIERCPHCEELLAITVPEEGGPLPGELIRCSTCGRTFVMQLEDMIQSHVHPGSGLGGAMKRIFFQLGAMVTGFVSAVLMLLVLVFWAFVLFLLGWVFGDEVFGVLRWVFT